MTDFNYEIKDLEAMSTANNYHNWVLSEFGKSLGKVVAEIGAGSGTFSSFLLQSPDIKKLTSIEPDKNACALYQKNISDPRSEIINGFLRDVSQNYQNNFDSVVYVNVLEHVEDDKAELAYVLSCLKSNGRISIFVPALPFLYSDHDKSIGHYRRYTKKQLKKVLEDSGFVVEKIKYFDIVGIVTWFIVFKLLKMDPSSGNVSFYDKLITPILRFVERLITPPIGKNLVAIGRKV